MRSGALIQSNYLEIVNVTPGSHPSVTGSSIASDSTGVYLNAAVNVDVSLPTVGAGVDQLTLNTTNVELYRTRDNLKVAELSVPVVVMPLSTSVQLDANTNTPLKSPTTSGMSSVLPSSLTAGHSIQEPAPA